MSLKPQILSKLTFIPSIMSNPHADEREKCQKKRKSTICESSSLRTPRRRYCNNKNEEEMNTEVSTTLKFYDDPWKIKKTITDSDLVILSRLLLAAYLVKKQILPILGVDHVRVAETEEGSPVSVWDMDTKSMHQLILKRWSSSKSYFLIGKWNQDFVRRRDLKKGDEIGFHWDPYNYVFNFCVLKRVISEN
ncbi:B3 domain-containing protein At2g33720 [Cajanus cajan]|nr:B3 domain-containing protein At2g33720 [Cajanus cajan]